MKANNSILIALIIVFAVVSFTYLLIINISYDNSRDSLGELSSNPVNLNANVVSKNLSSDNMLLKRTVVKSASEYDYPPFCIVDENGDASGFSVELLKEVLNAVDMDVTFYTGPWSEIKNDLAEGSIQVLPLVGRTPEREKLYDFSVPYETLYGAIFIRMNSTGIITLSDLKDKQVIVMKSDNAEEFVNRINLSDNIITTVNYEEAFRLLSAGKYDAVIVQDRVGLRLLKELNITNVFLVSKIPEFRQDFTFAVKKGDSELLAKLNEGLSKIIAGGIYDRIHDRWFDNMNDIVDETASVGLIPIDPKTRAELIIEYDQQLTADSEKYIATKDEYWKNDYDVITLRFNNLITQLKMEASIQKNPYLIDLFDRLDESAVQLFRMEFIAHSLAKEGRTNEANAIITGDEYLKYKKIYSDIMTEYLTFLGVDAETVYTEKINEMILQTHISQYAEKINDRFDVFSKIPDPAEFMRMIIKNSVYENTLEFNDKFSIIDGAWRTNLSYYNRSFGTDDVAGVMLYSDYELDDYKKRLMLSLSRDLKTYAVSTNKIFINRYSTFENGVDSMYPNEWIFEAKHDDDFKNDLWYYIANPQHDPEKKSKWTPVYYDSVLGYWMVSLITPIYDGDTFIGTTGGDITLDDINNQISGYNYYGRGYSFIFDDKKNILIHPAYTAEIEKRGMMEELFTFTDIKEKGLSNAISSINNDNGLINFNDDGTDYTMIYYKLDSIGWYYGFVIESAYIDRDVLLGSAKDNNYSIDSEIENSILMKTTQTRSLFYKFENSEIEKIKALLNNFIKQEDYKTVFLENNRTKLYEKSLNLFNTNKEKYSVTHFYYIYPNSTTFLRVHVPEQYGDSANRITFHNSVESNSWGTGFELGKTAFALRVVHPYYYGDSEENNDSVIGYVEFAEDMDYFIQHLKQQTKSDYGIIVKKEYINQSDWANVRKTKNLRDNYDDMQKYLIIDSTGSDLLFNELCFTQERLDRVTDEGNILGRCKIGQKTYVTSGFTLFDANNSAVGAVVLIHDISEFVEEKSDNDSKTNLSIETIVYLFIVFLTILGLVLYILDRLKIMRMKKDVSLILLFIALFIIIILFVFNGYTLTTSTTQNAVDTSSEQLNSIADFKQGQLELYLEEQKEKLEFAATHQEITNEELIDMIALQNDFDEMFVLNDKGIITQSTNIEHVGLDRSNDSYFINRKTKSYVKPAYLSDVTNIETITISTPYHSGVLVVRLNIRGFNELISDRDGLGETGEVHLAYRNPDGDAVLFSKRLFDNRTDVIIPREDTGLPMTQALLMNEQLFTDTKDYRNVSVIAATRYFAEADIGMVVKIDRAEVLKTADKINNQIWYFTLGIILAVFAVGVVFNILLTRSLRKEIQDKTGELQKKSDELQANIITLKNTKTAILNMMEDLNETNKHLKDLDVAKTNFLNVASHELKTPLTAMSAYLDVLDDTKGEFNEEQKRSLDAIKRNINQLTILINNILEISRIESGHFEVNITEVDVKSKILSVVNNLKILADNKNISMKTEIDENVPKIFTDDMRFNEILNNLISNAIKFTEKGSITVKANADESGKFITLSIIDTGVGIPEDKINNLFQNFYQVDSSISRKYGGTGLGLALTKKIIEHQGGKITVESVLGKGTTFTFTLPIEHTLSMKQQKSESDLKK